MQPWAEDRGEQGADLAGVDLLLAGLLEVAAEPEVVLDLDEQVGKPDRAAASVQPAVQLGEALGLRRVGLLGRVRLQRHPSSSNATCRLSGLWEPINLTGGNGNQKRPRGETWARNSAGIASPAFRLAKTASPSFSVFQ